MTEVLYGVRVIKLFSWEDYIYNKIQSLRKAEVSSLKVRYIVYIVYFCCFVPDL